MSDTGARASGGAERDAGPSTAAPVPLISVIVPVFKAEAYLARCLESIAGQTLDNIEIICIDDCSPDGSAGIAAAFAARDPRVRLLRHPRNLGSGGARNTGIRAARAPYVTGVDSDDYVHASMMEALWRACDGQRADVVECGFEQLAEDGTVLRRYAPEPRRIDNRDHQLNIFSGLKYMFWNKLWRRTLFTEHGIEFPDRMYYEDLATIPRLLAFARDIRVIPDLLYSYVRRPGSISEGWSARHTTDYFRCFDLLADFLREHGLVERYLPALLGCIGPNLHYHGRTVLGSAMRKKEKERYLRHLLMLKLAYLSEHERLSGMNAQQLLRALLHER